MTTRRFASLSLAALLIAGGSLGCQSSVPQGDPGGRIDVSRNTPAETRDPRILPTTLNEFSDYLSQEMIQEIAARPEIAPAGMRSLVLLGDIKNETQIVASTEFEYARETIRTNLINSNFAKKRILWVESRARMASLAAREGVGTVNNPAGPEAYDPTSSYALNMDVYRINRGSGAGAVNQYGIFARLVNFSTNEIIFQKKYEVKQVRGE